MRKIIEGNVDLRKLHLTELFDLSDVEVTGEFNCSHNNLTNLVGSPKSIGGSFSCLYNNLTSLIGATQTIGYDFNCSYNNLTNLIGAPKTVKGCFHCEGNNLTSLEGIPKRIGYGTGFFKNFYISKQLKDRFPEEYIRSLSKIRGSVLYW